MNAIAQRPPKACAVDPLAVFHQRAQARAYLWHVGELTLHEAVDDLQDTAERDGLILRIGQDAVQMIMAAAFRPLREDGRG